MIKLQNKLKTEHAVSGEEKKERTKKEGDRISKQISNTETQTGKNHKQKHKEERQCQQLYIYIQHKTNKPKHNTPKTTHILI
mmetsp:Transcript_28873/g.45715  ORF Transcript_28873/g.45715 Transcript_28873/m.45715 type:complete len:82 (+) Transcript_28873:109-354(+)